MQSTSTRHEGNSLTQFTESAKEHGSAGAISRDQRAGMDHSPFILLQPNYSGSGGAFLTFAIYQPRVTCLARCSPCTCNPPSLASPLPQQLSPRHTQGATLAGTGFPHSADGLRLNQNAPQSGFYPRGVQPSPPRHHPQQFVAGSGHQPWRAQARPQNQPCLGLTQVTNASAADTTRPGRCYTPGQAGTWDALLWCLHLVKCLPEQQNTKQL